MPLLACRDAILSLPGGLLSALHNGLQAMGYNARNDEIRDNVTRMREWEAQRDALATVRPLQCNTLGQRVFRGSGPRLLPPWAGLEHAMALARSDKFKVNAIRSSRMCLE